MHLEADLFKQTRNVVHHAALRREGAMCQGRVEQDVLVLCMLVRWVGL